MPHLPYTVCIMIGIYDSGIGGLGIFNEVRNVLPKESITYFGDTQYFPFGDRSAEEVREITLAGLSHLAETCNIIVIACNTASVSDLDYFRSQINVPIIAVVPVIKTAAELTNTHEFALLATKATCSADYTKNMIAEFAADDTVHSVACAGLANAVEFGDEAKTQGLITEYTKDLGDSDVIVLGCTHYTLIKGAVQYAVGPDVKVIDSNEAVARQVLRVMQAESLENPQDTPEYNFSCSGDAEQFLQQVQKYT